MESRDFEMDNVDKEFNELIGEITAKEATKASYKELTEYYLVVRNTLLTDENIDEEILDDLALNLFSMYLGMAVDTPPVES
jgi:hypothetical protein